MPWTATAPLTQEIDRHTGLDSDVMEVGEGEELPPGVGYGSFIQYSLCVTAVFFSCPSGY